MRVRRGLPEHLTAMEKVFLKCFPPGWQFTQTMEDGTGFEYLVLESDDHGIVGFAAFSVKHRYLAHLAVLPGFRKPGTLLLWQARLQEMRQYGLDNWFGRCRPETSYRLYCRRRDAGEIVFVCDEPGPTVNGEVMRKVRFRIVS